MRTVQLELSCPSEVLGTGTDSRLRFLFTLHHQPVGSIEQAIGEGQRDVTDALRRCFDASRADAVLELLAGWATEPSGQATDRVSAVWASGPSPWHGPLPSLTVAVCTRDRPEHLADTLDALQAAAAGGADVVVVDNAPRTEATRELVTQRFCWVRYVRESAPGLDRARNRALTESAAEIVAFCDDDAAVDDRWSNEIRRLFGRNPDLTLATGLVEPASLDSEAAQWFERYGGFGRGFRRRWVHAVAAPTASIAFRFANTGAYGTGTNFAIRRRAALALGGFDPALDVGTVTNGGGDLEMMFRVIKSGGLVAYHPAAFVRHQHRQSYGELASQLEGWGTGMSAHLARVARAYPEERLAVLGLRGWLSAVWFARRYASSWIRQTFPRELILTEWRASLRGGALYREASDGHAPPERPLPLHAVRGAPGTVESRLIELSETEGALGSHGAERIRLRVALFGRRLGEVEVPVIDGVVGEDRWRDAVGRAFRRELLGGSDHELRRRLLQRALDGAGA